MSNYSLELTAEHPVTISSELEAYIYFFDTEMLHCGETCLMVNKSIPFQL